MRGDVVLPGEGSAPSWLATVHLGDEHRVAALPADHPLAARERLDLDALAGEAIIVNRVGGITHPELWPARRRPRVAREVANTDDWLLAIAAGDGIGVTTTTTAATATHPDVVFVPMPDAPVVPLRLAWRTDRPGPPGPAGAAPARRARCGGQADVGRCRRSLKIVTGRTRGSPSTSTSTSSS